MDDPTATAAPDLSPAEIAALPRAERIEALSDKSKRLAAAPGVYLMKDAKGRVIYVGKATSLRSRVGSYFQPSTKLEHKKAGLLDEVVDFETIGTDSEVEALLAENRLIKDIRPRFNSMLMDDKSFPYLMVTTGDQFPGVYVTREPRDKGAKLYGPFTSVYALREAVGLLQRAFKFRTCELEILETDRKRKYFRPCLLHSINQCTAPCADRISRDDYRKDVNKLMRFLDGDREKLIGDLTEEMKQAAADKRFERAGRLRDEIKALKGLDAKAGGGTENFWQPEAFVSNPKDAVPALQKALGMGHAPRVIEGFDIAHLQGGEMVGSKVCFIDGVPFKDGYRRYKIKHGQGNNDFLSLQEVVSRRYREAAEGNELFPDLIMIDGGLGQLNSVREVFADSPHRPPMLVSLAKKEELIYVEGRAGGEPVRLPRNHQGLKMLQYLRDEAHRFAQHYHHLLRSKAQLEDGIKSGRRPPKRVRKPKELATKPASLRARPRPPT